jgi:hypothetical protein
MVVEGYEKRVMRNEKQGSFFFMSVATDRPSTITGVT